MEKINNLGDLETLSITENTLKKINAYSRLVCREKNLECYGFLLNPKEKNNHIAYNAILACNQIVSGCAAEIGPEGAFNSKAEIENMGYDVIGCWHSHHGMGAWHSDIDDSNLEGLANFIAGTREIILVSNNPIRNDFERNRFLIREGGIEVEIKSPKPLTSYLVERKTIDPNINYMHTKDNKFYLNLGEKVISLPLGIHNLSFKRVEPEKLRSLGYAYSLVASNGKFYAEVALKEICSVCEKSHLDKKKVNLNVIKPESDISFTEKELLEEISQKIKRKGLIDRVLNFK